MTAAGPAPTFGKRRVACIPCARHARDTADGAEGEPVDFARTIVSHGVAELLPNRVDLEGRTLETTLPVKRVARTVRITADKTKLKVEVTAGSVAPQLAQTVAHMFRLDEDLSGFYELVRNDQCHGAHPAPAACCARRPSLRTS